MSENHIVGCILGTAIGDSLGLPYEGLSKTRARKLLGPPDRQRFFFGRGMVSDDTEHTCMVAQSLIASGDDVDAFQRSLSWRFRFWLTRIPAGVGLATLRSILRLWIGVSPKRSGVFSAGNGPAMRSAILGASVDDLQLLRKLVAVSTKLTHTDPKAEYGALAVASAAHMVRETPEVEPQGYLEHLQEFINDSKAGEFMSLMSAAVESVRSEESTESFAASIGKPGGVSGYVYHTVPVVIHAWLSHPLDFRAAVTAVIQCGGDTDTTGAIVGGIVGTAVGREGLPSDWLSQISEWPCSVSWMERLGRQLHSTIESGNSAVPIKLSPWALLLRNLFFLKVVLFHGFRRLAPPY